MLEFPTPKIPPIAADTIKIIRRIRVEIWGVCPNAARPIMVNNKKSVTPQIKPIIKPFFSSFLAANHPDKKEPIAMLTEAVAGANPIGSMPNESSSAEKTKSSNIAAIPSRLPRNTGLNHSAVLKLLSLFFWYIANPPLYIE